MAKLHEVLAVEKEIVGTAGRLMAETTAKFHKEAYFTAFTKKLSLFNDSPGKAQVEAAGSASKEMQTTVVDTLEYALKFWADAEDVLFTKNKANQNATADILFEGKVIAEEVPVDELMGLENRLSALRNLLVTMPTLEASKRWEPDATTGKHVWLSQADDTVTKTEKVTTPVVLYEATKEHPAQVKEVSQDIPVGVFVTKHWSGAASAAQKARVLEIIDTLIREVKSARVKANQAEAPSCKIGGLLVGVIMKAFE